MRSKNVFEYSHPLSYKIVIVLEETIVPTATFLRYWHELSRLLSETLVFFPKGETDNQLVNGRDLLGYAYKSVRPVVNGSLGSIFRVLSTLPVPIGYCDWLSGLRSD